MKKKKERRTVTVELCDNKRKYRGRLLGLVNDSEFFRILSSRRTQNKVFSSATKPLEEIAEYAKFDGLRLVVAVKEIDDKVIGGKQLFVTEKLDMIGTVETNQQIGILSKGDEYIIVSEGKE